MAETAPEALEDESSFLLSFSSLCRLHWLTWGRGIKGCWMLVLTKMERWRREREENGGKRRDGGWMREQGEQTEKFRALLSVSSTKWPSNYRAKSDIKASRVKEDSLILSLFLYSPHSLPPSFSLLLFLLYLFSSMSHPGEEEQGQAPLISYLITLVMLHIIGKRWAKWTNKLSDMGLPSPRTLQSQGHLGKRRDTYAVTEEDRERRSERKEN